MIWDEQPCFYSVTYYEATNTVAMVINLGAHVGAGERSKRMDFDYFLFLDFNKVILI